MGREVAAISGRLLEAAVAAPARPGPGVRESVPENAMLMALRMRRIPHESLPPFDVVFEGVTDGTHRGNLVVDKAVGIELEPGKALEEIHFAQSRSCGKASRLRAGLRLEFDAPIGGARRVVR